jgi:hypothetical protein
MIDNWMHAHRLSRAVFLAIVLLGLLVWSLLNKPPAMVDRSIQTAEVVSVIKDGATLIKLPDGRHVRTFTPQPLPQPGDAIPMIVESYEDGTAMAVVDLDAWRSR